VATTIGIPAAHAETRETGDAAPAESTAVETTYLRVEGMHCATCETFLEGRAEATAGVVDAEASYVTETVAVEYDPDRTSPEALQDRLTTLGYTAQPRDAVTVDAMAGRPDAEGHPRDREPGFDDLIGYRYAAGIIFGSFLLLPYLVSVYPGTIGVLFDIPQLAALGTSLGFATDRGLASLPFFRALVGVVLVFSGMPLPRGALVSLKTREPNTDLLVTTMVLSTCAYSIIAAVLGRGDLFFDATVVIAATVVAAIFYEILVKRRALSALTDLTVSRVEEATRYGPDGTTWSEAVADLTPGDRVLVRAGERVPVDGTLEEGPCAVDEAVVTGESLPVTKRAGDTLRGGSVVTDGAAVLAVAEGATSSIDRLTTAVWDRQRADHGVQRRADRLAAVALPVVVALAVLVAAASLVRGTGWVLALLAGLGTIIVASPWAIGLATPLSVATNVRAALERGIVVFDDTIFERLRDVDVVVFDKTGTLTTGEMRVIDADGPADLLGAAGAIEARASHPAGVAIADAYGPNAEGPARADGGDGATADSQPGTVEDFERYARGVAGTVAGDRVLVGSPALFADEGWSVPDEIAAHADEARADGHLPVLVGRDGAAAGLILVGDTPRDGWREVVSAIAGGDREVVVLTGDEGATATAVGEHPDVDHVFAGIPPAGKTATVRRLQADARVAMVGDGTNDAPALAAADLGISLGGGTALAAEAADVTLVADDLHGVPTAFDLAGAASTRTKQTIGLAFAYNALAVPVALVGLLNPVTLALSVTVAGVLVGANCWRELLDRGV
jgi:heavy metal translocating P-type ATPase